jgi:hypothetical protein
LGEHVNSRERLKVEHYTCLEERVNPGKTRG